MVAFVRAVIKTLNHLYILTFLHSYICTFAHSHIHQAFAHSHICTFAHYYDPMNKTNNNNITGAEILMRALIDEGVKTLFGYPGGAIMPV